MMSILIIVACNHKENPKLTKQKLDKAFNYNPQKILLEANWKSLGYMNDQRTAFIYCIKKLKWPKLMFNDFPIIIPEELKTNEIDNTLYFDDCYPYKPTYCKHMEKHVLNALRKHDTVCVVTGSQHVKHLSLLCSDVVVIAH